VPTRAHLDLIVRAMPQIQLDATLFATTAFVAALAVQLWASAVESWVRTGVS